MDGNTLFMLLFGVILVGYGILYIGGRNYLREGYQDGGAAGAASPTAGQLYPTPLPVMPSAAAASDSKESVGGGRVLMEYTTMDPVAKDAIRSLDDYEYNMVFQNESDRRLSQALKNKLMSQRPMEWAGLPPSSSQFQAGLRESFQNASATVPDDAKPYDSVSGNNMVPPDTAAMESEERKILQSYVPPMASDLPSYDPDKEKGKDPKDLIHKLYDSKGLIPTICHKDGTNVYNVTGVRRKDEKVIFEDEEAPASTGPDQNVGEATIEVPPAAYDMAASKDPYYNTNPGGGGRSRIGKWNYQAWTPGLERVFAPTDATPAWS